MARNRILSLVLLSMITPVALAQTSVGFIISGTVRLPDGNPAARASIRATSAVGVDRQAFADDMGRYEIRDLPRGRYYLTATLPTDDTLFTDPVEVDTTRSLGNRYLAHINLRKKFSVSDPKGKASTISVAEASQHVPKNAQKAFEQGIRFRASHDNAKALEHYNRSIELFPEYFQAYAERGHLKIGMGQVAQAAEDFSRALTLNERYEPALRGSGICKIQSGRYDEAVGELERATVVDGNNAMTFLFLGVAHASLDHRDSARRALEKALSLDSAGAARARVHLANLALKENRLQDAAAQLDAYLAAAPNAPDADKLRAVRAEIASRLAK